MEKAGQGKGVRSHFMAIAHRGASSYAPENTFAAFDLALELGARELEFDVQESADGELIVIHDDTVDRTTDGTGAVTGLTLDALRRLDAGTWFDRRYADERIPTLAGVLERYATRARLHVELKGKTSLLTGKTVESIRRHGATGAVTLTSFQRERLVEARTCAPELPAGWLVRSVDDGVVAAARELKLAQLCPRADIVTSELVQRLHGAGFEVRAWGVGTEALMERVVRAGADGMTVNFPDRLIAYLGRGTQAGGGAAGFPPP
jgi:glycerophosphoryl diester phosphodiesterase